MLRSSRPLTTIKAKNPQQRFEAIAELIEEWRPDLLVVGQPLHPDGQSHEMTEHCIKFARKLRGRFSLPVHMVDERYSSETEDDADAAAVILQQYLDALKN